MGVNCGEGVISQQIVNQQLIYEMAQKSAFIGMSLKKYKKCMFITIGAKWKMKNKILV